MQLTPNFTLAEFTRSQTASRLGIDNHPSDAVVRNLLSLCRNLLQPLRELVGRPLIVTSGYRCPALNRAVGGVAHSQHLVGEAADLRLPTLTLHRADGTPYSAPDLDQARRWMDLVGSHLHFDQLILEHDRSGAYWLHLSYRQGRNRHQVIGDLLKGSSR